MRDIYRVTIHGRILESRDLKQLLARAVSEKRCMDRRFRFLPPPLPGSGFGPVLLGRPATRAASRLM